MKKYNFDSSEASMAASDFFETGTKGTLTISACAIMRNEISYVEAWLSNVRSYADEIIVVDTGSEDGTKEFLAKQEDVNLICSTWQDDFALAKNVALKAARMDWVVFTDADECFYQPENISVYLQELENQSANTDVVFCPIDNIDADNHDELIDSDVVPRMIRNHRGIRYLGAVHEQLAKGKEPWRDIAHVVADRRLAIRHTGYKSSVVAAKHERNYHIICNVMAKSDKPEMYYGFLSESLLGLNRYQEALENAILAIESPYQPVIQKERFCQVAVEAMDKLGLSIQDIFSPQQAENICQIILDRNKWHEVGLCQWLDINIQNNSESILQKLNNLYGDSEQDKKLLWELLQKNGYLVLAEQFARENSLPEEMDTDMSEIYQLISQGEADRAEKILLSELPEAQQMLFVSLLGVEYSSAAWYQERLRLLPSDSKTLVCLYHGHTSEATLTTGAYSDMLKGVLRYGNKEMLLHYLKLSRGMPGDCLKSIGFMLTEREYYAEALEVFGQIQADDEAVDGVFWLYCGKCLYYLNEYDSAMEALNMARENGCDTAELSAYEAWCREAAGI